MQIKDKISKSIFILFLFIFNSVVYAEELNISAKEVSINKKDNIVIGEGEVEVIDSKGRVINANKVIYERSKEFLQAEGSVVIFDLEGNTLKTSKASYDQKNGFISSNEKSIFNDKDGNVVNVDMFQYEIENNLFSSVGNIKIIDNKKNKYFFKELHIDTKSHEMVGSEVSVLLDQKDFNVDEENDPRFAANDILVSENKTILSKGVFTVCKKRDGKCPPWLLKAKKITHDKIKKTIYYKHATLKVYDIPVFYFPAFFHPDPTVKRQSGFLNPFFADTQSLGTGFGLPYFWAIDVDRDLTFTPKMYSKENPVFLNEYRQAFRNGFMILDTSYSQGYKNTSVKKTKGSRNHIFAELNFNLSDDPSYESEMSIKTQRASNNTYFRVHDINTELVDAENTNLENIFNYNFGKDNAFFNISATAYEDLRDDTNSKYEYILPNILFGKSFFTEKFGTLDFTSNSLYRNYKVNKHLTSMTNDIVWRSNSSITTNGFINNLEGRVKNTNYEAKNTGDYKTESLVNELSGVLTFKSSRPMKKTGANYSNIFSPNFMVRYAPGHMRNLRGEDILLKYANLFSTNKTSTIESGLSSVIGFDFKTREKINGSENEKLSISMGQVFSPERNKDLPTKSSLDQKMSDVVGEIKYNFSKIGTIDYKFSLDHNYNDLNYNEVSTTLNFGKVNFNLDYLEEHNHVGQEHYVNAGVSLNFNDNNKLSFETKKNYKTNSTELYDIAYQYKNDCLRAGLVFRREFYEDSDLEQKDSLMFVVTFIPFTGARAPLITP